MAGNNNIVPSFKANVVPQPSGVATPGDVNGISITVEKGALEWIMAKIEEWFEERDEIALVGHGKTSKIGDGFITLEWDGCQVDPLFLKILEHEDQVIDYAEYNYGDEEE
jgi:hypothetical protein